MAPESANPPAGAEQGVDLESLYPLVTTPPAREGETRPRPLSAAASFSATTELLLAASGVGLSVFLLMHLMMLCTVLIGQATMDQLAFFLEEYYLLHLGAVPLIAGLIVHVVLVLRRLPTSLRAQRILWGHLRSVRHFDTWTWGVQLVTGLLMLALISIHLWVILSTLPISSGQSGGRVFTTYLWFYVPFLLLVESHLSMGIYRIWVKWDLASRRLTHTALTVWTCIALGLGFWILVMFYRIGAGLS
jgi:fumarate reductase subunit C